ncbi:MAG: glycine--tRNA ligase subunit beta [Sphingomonadales bacterium 35-56-22]|jgi:glycyl-tRNA synthetase beta chain|uniref:glycine--tRNA ligase subunit beta n=1 Tax=Sphingorhabdus sp. TaxID=1902408 RepID=UPI000BC4ED00|nr:glycine--tRNA ligase subunit beta [Sphingorhabdus sp.]OYY16850.1 MAG: glycine--tRNA ligase subunit beta [Sphingomonadales bacterium 35-56-22]OYY99005.1 MAG: glycine--tRNA ligase subunit beta [Sphingomonadales bacterium 28-56-43]OYZ61600.1 MAG: glycine--tRNA ligase subunit beta [Sphingomonadales bacterium 24-56-14]OZA83360.1 MAG: glycine--tRNA ligase subunit beta [Sphingomonadales bacterium 39-57-19]HQS12277.1 glycine--tRNA ligase subunit beta [Sphingorhabdus sp.]
MTDFLLELRSEEIPARMQVKAKEDLARLFNDALAKAGLAAASVETFATPRRLALIATGLPLATDAVSEETKGPKVGAPPQAMEGFLRKAGLTQDQLIERDGVYFAVVEKAGRQTADVLAEAIPAIIRAFPWPKSQRWGAGSASTESLRWVRPLQGIVAILGDDVVPCEIEGIVSGTATMGHRFHHSGPVTIGNAGDYAEKLRDAHVLVHFSERCALIRDGAKAAAAAAGLTLVADEGLVVENAGLTEWPVPMLGRFDPAFLEVPQEVIQLTARVNQKYFVCHDSAGKLANAFVCTANIAAHDGGAAIVAGNEKVLAARLSDAKFFWEQDLKVALDDQATKLTQITFHEKLGSVADKVERVARLARWLVEEGILGPCSPAQAGAQPANNDSSDKVLDPGLRRGTQELADQAERAARLCKADLVTGMVGEFPELQGLMGGYYARAQGETDAVADAVRDHYKPVGQGDEVPTAPVTVAVSLADKLDTLAQFFAAGMPPTGSKDPFALRRAAIGFLSLLLQNDLRCSLKDMLLATGAGNSFDSLEEFLVDRLKVQQREAGVRHDLIDAVFSLGGEDDLVRLLARVKALQAYITTAEGANLLAAYKRAANILKAADGVDAAAPAPADLVAEERALLTALDTAAPNAAAAVDAEDFEGAMAALASLRAPIDAFFDGVMVNDEDPAKRAFRLGLLARFRDAVTQVADFSKVEG